MSTRPDSDRIDQAFAFTIPVADRLRKLPPYLFGKINELRDKKRKAGIDVIDLGMGNPTEPAEKHTVERLREAALDAATHRYSAAWGILELRREAATQYERRYGVSLDPSSEVIATIGSKEGFSHLCLALLGPGDVCISPAPTFPVHVHAPALASASVLELDVTDPKAYLKNLARTCEMVHPKPKLVIVNFPHNPSSTTVDQGFYHELVALAKRFGFLVISDFAYADICFDGYQAPSFLATPGAKEVGVEFTTMSKGHNMAGWRVGFCAGHREMVKALGTIKGYYDYGIFEASQLAAITALQHGATSIPKMCDLYQRRRDALVGVLQQGGWNVTPPKAGMFVWAEVPAAWKDVGTIDLAMKLIEEAHVTASPGAGFGPQGEGFLRLALVESEERLKRAAEQMNKVLAGRRG
jgi:alanine-synthesizing transaminase